MSYVSPTITASGGTFAQLQAEGWAGHVERVIAANTFSQAQINFIRALVSGTDNSARISTSISNWLSGKPIDPTEVSTRFLNHATVLKAILAALEEINVLAAANPGSLHRVAGNVSAPQTRTWP
jgi:hypothetical protein